MPTIFSPLLSIASIVSQRVIIGNNLLNNVYTSMKPATDASVLTIQLMMENNFRIRQVDFVLEYMDEVKSV